MEGMRMIPLGASMPFGDTSTKAVTTKLKITQNMLFNWDEGESHFLS